MKKKPKTINDLSQLSSVISFSKIDKQAYDGVCRFERDGDNVRWVADDNGNWRIVNLPKEDES